MFVGMGIYVFYDVDNKYWGRFKLAQIHLYK